MTQIDLSAMTQLSEAKPFAQAVRYKSMPCFVAFHRGVMPTDAKMPALKAAFEEAGFAGVRPILGSGNLAFETSLLRFNQKQRPSRIARLSSVALQ
ncbi:MAG: DUF1697 domain-containing protein [Ideonella sp.]